MHDLRALWYLAMRFIRNDLDGVVRSPRRAATWLLLAGVTCVSAWFWWHQSPDPAPFRVPDRLAAVMPAGLAAAIAAIVGWRIGEPGWPPSGDGADLLVWARCRPAAVLIATHLTPRIVGSFSFACKLAPFALFFVPRGPATYDALLFCAVLLAMAICLTLVPILMAMRPDVRRRRRAIVYASAGAAVAFFTAGSSGAAPPPTWFAEPATLGALLSVDIVLFALAWRGSLGGDEAATRNDHAASATASPSSTRAGYGIFAGWWRRNIEARRNGGQRAGWWLIGSALAAGAIAGVLARSVNGQLAWLAGFGVANALIIINAGDMVTLRESLSVSLWWVSRSSLRRRLLAESLAALRWQVPATMGFAGAFAVVARQSAALASTLVVTAAIAYALATISMALSLAFPDAADARGPAFLVRLMSIYTIVALSLLAAYAASAHADPAMIPLAAGGVFLIVGLLAHATFIELVRRNPALLIERA